MRQSFLKGTIFITVSTIISKVLGSLFRIPIQNIAGDEVLGIFTLVYPLYMVVLTLSVAGIPLAISKLISESNARGKFGEIKDIFLTAKYLALTFGVFGWLILLIFSEPISVILGGSSTQAAIIVVSFTLVIAPYMSTYRGFFQGFGDMGPTAFSQVLEQFVRVVLIILFALLFVGWNENKSVIAAGVMAGSIAGALTAFIYLRWKFTRANLMPVIKHNYRFKAFKFWSGRILRLSIPIAIGTLTMAFLNLVDSLSVPTALKIYGQSEITKWYGIYGRGLSLVQIATVFSSSVVLPLVPAIADALAKNDRIKASRFITHAERFNAIISWPLAIGLFVLAMPINIALFGDSQGTLLLALFGLSSIVNAQALLGTGILTGINRQKSAARIILLAVVIKIVLNFVLVIQIGLVGAIISTMITYGLIVICNGYLIRKEMGSQSIIKENLLYVIVSILMAVVISLPTLFFHFTVGSRGRAFGYAFLMAIIGMFLYGIVIWRIKGLDMFVEIPIIGEWAKKFSKNK